MSKTSEFLELNSISKYFGNHCVIENMTFSVAKGQILGLLGTNGAGKTTTFRMIAGFLRPDNGSIKIMGHDIEKSPTQTKFRIGYLAEGCPLYREMTTREFIKFISNIRGLDKQLYSTRLEYVTEILGLSKVMNLPIYNLSKGFKRRLGLAQAIIHDPDILILDEPTDGLDPIQKEEVYNLLNKISQHKAILISTHNLEEAERICSKMVIIREGKIAASGSQQSITSSFKSCSSLRDVFHFIMSENFKYA